MRLDRNCKLGLQVCFKETPWIDASMLQNREKSLVLLLYVSLIYKGIILLWRVQNVSDAENKNRDIRHVATCWKKNNCIRNEIEKGQP